MRIHVRAPVSEQDVSDELFEMARHLPMFPDDDNQLSREACRQRDTNELLRLIIQGQGSNWYKADSHAEGDEIDYQIEVVELHGGFNAPPLRLHP